MTKTTVKKAEKTETPSAVKTEVGKTEVPAKEYEWSKKYEACTKCGTTELKHYSGGQCTRCYTEMRNQKLGLGKYDPRMVEKKAERLDQRIDRMNAKLAELKKARQELAKAS